MKKKIIQLSKGEFDFPQHELVFPETRIIMKVGEGETYSGSFTLRNEGEGLISGLVYPSSFRVRCNEPGFEGTVINVKYVYDGRGLEPGHVEHGKFTIASNAGEYDVRFTAIVEKPYVMTPYGKVDSLNSFRRLAFKDSGAARELFASKDFYTILKYEGSRTLALYNNMRNWKMDKEAVEEFLVACKRKERISLFLEEESRAFISLEASRSETVTIKKNTWGFLPIKVSTSGDFLSTPHPRIHTEEFIGNSYRLEYYINVEKLYRGSNFGEITFSTPYETLTYEVVVEKDISRDEDFRKYDRVFAGLLRDYFDYEANEIGLEDWLAISTEKIEKLRERDAENEYYLLVHANILLIGDQAKEAKWILESYNYNRFSSDKEASIDAYYLYLTALLENDTLGLRRIAEELSILYYREPGNWKILCMLVQVDSEFKIYSERLRVLEDLFNATKTPSTLFYFEAFKCIRERPDSLRKLGPFEIRVLLFGAKYKLITKELALYTANLASQIKTYDEFLFRALELSYEQYPEAMILSAISTLLIRGQREEARYFKWYEKAVLEEQKIPQLYEYYISSLDMKVFNKALPRTVYLYFMHGNTLDTQKAAFLYSNIISYEDETSEIYTHYRDEMERFAWNQLERRRINDQFRVIYKRFILERLLNHERINALYDICHAYEITTTMKNMESLYVIGEDGKILQSVDYKPGGVKVYLYSNRERIIWKSQEGRHYIDTIPYESRRFFYELRYLDMCRKYLSNTKTSHEDARAQELTLESVRKSGYRNYPGDEIFYLASKTIRETNFEKDDFLIYLSYRSFLKKRQDKATLAYLAKHYVGGTSDMKRLWNEANAAGVPNHELAERILSQMLFTESLFREEEIFESYYAGGAYFSLQRGYLAYVSREYVVFDRVVSKGVFDVICTEYEKGEKILDISKIALLKYYSTREFEPELRKTLRKFLQELCGRQIYFDFFLNYEEEWLIEVQLWDKVLLQYKGQKDSRVILYYKLRCEDSNTLDIMDYSTEVLTPMYENIFVKRVVLFANERLEYYFKETVDGVTYKSEKRVQKNNAKRTETGKYGRINQMITMEVQDQQQAIRNYAIELETALKMFSHY